MLILLDTFLAAEKDEAIAQVFDLLHFFSFTRHVSRWKGRPRALGLMTDKPECVYLNLFSLNQSGGALDDQL